MSKRNGEGGRAGFAVLITLTVIVLAAAVAVGVWMIASRRGGNVSDGDGAVTTTVKTTETEPPAPKKFTVNMQQGSENAGMLVLVNATHAYSFPEDEQLVNLYEEGMGEHVKLVSSDIRLRPEAMKALRDLSDAFYEVSGRRELLIASGYRSYDEQVEIYSSRVDSKGIEYAKKYDIHTIFFEELASPKVAKTVAKEVDAVTAVLNPIEGLSEEDIEAGEDYFSVMRKNLEALRKALN